MTDAAAPAGRASPRTLLLLLAGANFTVGFGAFVVVAILPPLAGGLGVGEAAAGWIMTSYALCYAVGSPLGVALTGRLGRRAVLSGGLALFGAGAVLCALAPSFGAALAGRAVMALGGGLVTPVAASVALGLVAAEARGRALATVFGGLTLAQAVGIPIGAWLGYAFGWRETFGLAALLSLPMAALLMARLPSDLSVPVTGLGDLARALRRPDLAVAVSFTVLFMGGVWTLYTYVAPLLEARLGVGGAGVSAMMLVFGIGAVLGNAMGGRLTDRIGPDRTLALLCAAQLVMLPLVSLAPFGTGTAGLALGGIAMLAWSVAGWSFMVPQQARLAGMEPALAPVLLALNAAAIYVAASLGSAVGAAVLGAAGLGPLGPVGAGIVVLALASLPLAARLRARQSSVG